MAYTYTNLLEPPLRVSFDEDNLAYQVNTTFSCEIPEEGDPPTVTKDLVDVIEDEASGTYAAADWEGGGTKAAIPEKVVITYSGQLASTGASTQDVDCFIGNVEVVNTTTENVVHVNVTYVGRVIGVISAAPRTQMSSVRQPHSLDLDADGDRIGIGPDFEGVARHMPISIIQITEVIPTTSAIPGRIDDTKRQAGSVNEANWIAPWGTSYAEGTWVYMGIVGSAHDRRTDTVEIMHEIMQQGDRVAEGQHNHRWFRATNTKLVGDATARKYETTPTTAQFLPVAGTDTWFDTGTAIGTWSSTINLDEMWL